MYRFCSILGVTILMVVSFQAPAEETKWSSFVRSLRTEAIADGIRPDLFDEAMRGVVPNKRVIRLDRAQPEKRLTFLEYRRTRADAYRIKLGKRAYRKHRALVDEIGHKYQVDPCFLISVWGMETSYGNYRGHFPVIKSLATLAFDQRRGDFFRKELLLALHIVQDGHVDLAHFVGEWAGGSGHPQFLPSSWHRYAVDHDEDGRKDIWGTLPDVFASIANYYRENGWQPNQPWAAKVSLPKRFAKDQIGYKTSKTIAQWKKLGVIIHHQYPLPPESAKAWIVQPYGGPTIMAFENFRVIMRYNNSTFYAGAIGYMADAICSRKQSL